LAASPRSRFMQHCRRKDHAQHAYYLDDLVLGCMQMYLRAILHVLG
jgi:hypothetical protein